MTDEIIVGLIVAAAGGLINFIGTKIYQSYTGLRKTFLWKNKYRTLDNVSARKDFEDLKKAIRIIVIDDEDIFPVALFISAGYFIEKWDKVKDYPKLESGYYDIIILDIINVATEISQEDGLGVLESLKRNNPSQIIVAYSGHSFDLSKQRFWDLADEKIAKPSDFLKTKEIIDNLILSKFKPDRYLIGMKALLKRADKDDREINILEGELFEAIKEKRTKEFGEKLKVSLKNADLASQALNLLSTILKFFNS